MNNRDFGTLNTGPAPKHLAPADAAQAIHVLQMVLDRLGDRQDRLAACVGFAQEAIWAAAYPNDPNTMLEVIAGQAQNAMG